MTTITLDIIFITAPLDHVPTPIHAATAVGYEYNALCGRSYKHDAGRVVMLPDNGRTLSDVCQDCRDRMATLGMATEGHPVNELGMIVSEPDLLRAVQHLFEAARHVNGYCKLCPVCGGTQVDGDEGCRMCAPLVNIHAAVEVLNRLANHMLEIEDPFEGIR